MIFYFLVLYFLVVVDVASSELILKIDINESTDERTTANFLYITFVNTTDSEHMLDDDQNIGQNINENTEENLNKKIPLGIKYDNKDNVNRIHQLVKRNPENDFISVSFNGDTLDNNIPPHPYIDIPLVQVRGENSKIKEYLDDFKMSKKRTYVSTPNYNFPFKKYYKFDSGENYILRRKDIPNPIFQMERETEIFDVISKQNKLIERIANKVLETEKRKKRIERTIFNDILESVEARQHQITAKDNVTTTTETSKLSTVLTIVDETEIREALKKDPFVSRILRMAAKKKQKYEAKKQTEADFLT